MNNMKCQRCGDECEAEYCKKCIREVLGEPEPRMAS